MSVNRMQENYLEEAGDLFETLVRKYRGRAEFCNAKSEGPEALANYIFEEIERGALEECDDEAVFTAARWFCEDDDDEEESLNESLFKTIYNNANLLNG